MRLLILGGTSFLSRAVAQAARERAHDVIVAARGLSGRAPPGTRFCRVDRDQPGGLEALVGERFDAVVDVSSRPAQVRSALAALAPRASQWIYVSSGKVYADLRATKQRASTAPVVPPAGPADWSRDDSDTLGPRKVACEQLVRAGTRRWLLVRPGLVVGPRDPVDRFGYWPMRLVTGGEVLVPGSPEHPVQFIDVRDLASWLVVAAEDRLTGTYDAVTPAMPRGEFLGAVAEGVGSTGFNLHWVDEDFLLEQGVCPWVGPRSLPLWMPTATRPGFFTFDAGPALAAGLRLREPALTARDTDAWRRLAGPDHRLAAGLTAEEETQLLLRWRTHMRPRPGPD